MRPTSVARAASILSAGLVIGLLLRDRGPTHSSDDGPRWDVAASSRRGSITEGQGERDWSFVGVVVAERAVDVTAPLGGRVEAIPVRLGDRVSVGDLLAKIDDRAIRSALEAAYANHRALQAARERSTLELEDASRRSARLGKAGDAVSTEELEAARLAVETSRARLAEADAALHKQAAAIIQLRDELASHELRASFDGVVSGRYLDPGAHAGVNALVVRVVSSTEPYLRFAVPEELSAALRPQMPVLIRLASGGRDIGGEIVRISPEIDPASGMIFAEAAFRPSIEDRSALMPGLLARVTLPKQASTDEFREGPLAGVEFH